MVMQNIPIYEALAQAFAAEGVDTYFTLMGEAGVWNSHVSDKVVAPQTRRTVSRGRGKM
jgi:hypothetical protein